MAKQSKNSKLKAIILDRFPPRWKIKHERLKPSKTYPKGITMVYLLTEPGNVFLSRKGHDLEEAMKDLDWATQRSVATPEKFNYEI